MDPLKQYKIPFTGLAIGKHAYALDADAGFFACFPESELALGQIRVDLLLEKRENMLVLDFRLQGHVEVACDRCLEAYKQEVSAQKRLYIKFGEHFDEQSEDMIVIPETETSVDCSHFIYEFIHLSLPLRQVHPDLPGNKPGCGPEAIERLNRYLSGDRKPDPDGASTWEALKTLRFN